MIARKDGSILVINYDEFRKIISQKCYLNSKEFMESDAGSDFEVTNDGESVSFDRIVDHLNQPSYSDTDAKFEQTPDFRRDLEEGANSFEKPAKGYQSEEVQ